VNWIVIDNPKSKLDFGFGLSIQFCHFNPNPKYQNYFIKKLKFHSGLSSNNKAKLFFIKIFKQLIYQIFIGLFLLGLIFDHRPTTPKNAAQSY
jgi:hypothetical protein